MKFISIAPLAICVVTHQAMAASIAGGKVQELVSRQGRPVAFNVAPLGTACGSGTTISCSPSHGSPCKGNFNPKQASIVITEAAGNCHVSLYPDYNQGGGIIQRLDTNTTGTCVFTSVATYQSYRIYCD